MRENANELLERPARWRYFRCHKQVHRARLYELFYGHALVVLMLHVFLYRVQSEISRCSSYQFLSAFHFRHLATHLLLKTLIFMQIHVLYLGFRQRHTLTTQCSHFYCKLLHSVYRFIRYQNETFFGYGPLIGFYSLLLLKSTRTGFYSLKRKKNLRIDILSYITRHVWQ